MERAPGGGLSERVRRARAVAIRIRRAYGPTSRSKAGARSSRACMGRAAASSSSSGTSGASPIPSIMTARFPLARARSRRRAMSACIRPQRPYVTPRALEDRGDSRRHRGLSPRRRERQGGRLRRRRDPRRERLSARPVPAGQLEQARRRLRRLDREPRPPAARSDGRGRLRVGRGPGRHASRAARRRA